jgi:hypothetical protein
MLPTDDFFFCMSWREESCTEPTCTEPRLPGKGVSTPGPCVCSMPWRRTDCLAGAATMAEGDAGGKGCCRSGDPSGECEGAAPGLVVALPDELVALERHVALALLPPRAANVAHLQAKEGAQQDAPGHRRDAS